MPKMAEPRLEDVLGRRCILQILQFTGESNPHTLEYRKIIHQLTLCLLAGAVEHRRAVNAQALTGFFCNLRCRVLRCMPMARAAADILPS